MCHLENFVADNYREEDFEKVNKQTFICDLEAEIRYVKDQIEETTWKLMSLQQELHSYSKALEQAKQLKEVSVAND